MRDGESLASEIVARAAQLGLRIAVAESLTGGMLASTLVSVPGASRVFSGGVIAYDTELKASLLRVDQGLLRERGPVDPGVARQMAAGVRRACALPDAVAAREPYGNSAPARAVLADVGVSTTGVAGPAADPHSGQPAGTVWLGVSSRLGERSQLLATVAVDRPGIRQESVLGALALLLAEIEALSSPETRSIPGES